MALLQACATVTQVGFMQSDEDSSLCLYFTVHRNVSPDHATFLHDNFAQSTCSDTDSSEVFWVP